MKFINQLRPLLLSTALAGALAACAGQPADDTAQALVAPAKATDVYERIDPQLTGPLSHLPPQLAEITRDNLGEIRAMMDPMLTAKGVPGVTTTRQVIDTDEGPVTLYIYRPEGQTGSGAGLYWTHGGGFILGSGDTDFAATLAKELNATVVSVDYRLAPEHPFPAGHNDAYRGFLWMVDHARELDVDPSRIAIGGDSAGAGMAASLALRNRDESGPAIAFQLLLYPMLDNLHATASGSVETYPVWSRTTSFNAWEMYLNGAPGLDASPYAAAARAKEVDGLPPAYVTVGSVDLFRDEVVDYAQRLMDAGVPTELTVFPGVYHSAEMFVPTAEVSQAMISGYIGALKGALSLQ